MPITVSRAIDPYGGIMRGAELPAGSAADMATAEGIVGVCETPGPSTRGRSTLLERCKLTGTLEKLLLVNLQSVRTI